jgi:YidC/Oxa1 family membrane protein insertase
MENATKMMTYIMPVMIAYFTSQVPSGVGLYWLVSTLYGIGQQTVVNMQSKKDTIKVKVLPNPKQ